MSYWVIVKQTPKTVLGLEGPYNSRGEAQLLCDAYKAVEVEPAITYKPMGVVRPFYWSDSK